jgi:hypothetical protein
MRGPVRPARLRQLAPAAAENAAEKVGVAAAANPLPKTNAAQDKNKAKKVGANNNFVVVVDDDGGSGKNKKKVVGEKGAATGKPKPPPSSFPSPLIKASVPAAAAAATGQKVGGWQEIRGFYYKKEKKNLKFKTLNLL